MSAIGFSADGSQIAASDTSGHVRVWNVATGAQLHDLTVGGDVTTLSWSPTHYLTVGQDTGQTVTFDLSKNQILVSLRALGAVNGVSYGPDDTLLAVGHENGDVALFDPLDQVSEPVLNEGSAVNAVSFSPKGTDVATVNGAGQIVIVNAAEVRAGASLTGVAFSPDGKTVALGDLGGNVSLWDAHTTEWRATIDDGAQVQAVVFLDNTTLAVADNKKVSIWNTTTEKKVTTISGPYAGPGFFLALSSDRHTLAVQGNYADTEVWNVADPAHPQRIPINQGGVSSDLGNDRTDPDIAIAPNGNSVLVGNSDGWVVSFAIPSGESSPLFRNASSANVLAISPDGGTVAVGDPTDVVLWSFAKRRVITTLHEGAAVTAVAFTDNGNTLLTGTTTGQVIVWDTATRARLAVLDDGDAGPVRAIAANPQSDTFAVSDQYGRLGIMPSFWTANVSIATKTLCNQLNGYELDRGQWQTFMPNESYRRTC